MFLTVKTCHDYHTQFLCFFSGIILSWIGLRKREPMGIPQQNICKPDALPVAQTNSVRALEGIQNTVFSTSINDP